MLKTKKNNKERISIPIMATSLSGFASLATFTFTFIERINEAITLQSNGAKIYVTKSDLRKQILGIRHCIMIYDDI